MSSPPPSAVFACPLSLWCASGGKTEDAPRGRARGGQNRGQPARVHAHAETRYTFLAAHRAPCRASRQRGRQGHHHHLPAADVLSSLELGRAPSLTGGLGAAGTAAGPVSDGSPGGRLPEPTARGSPRARCRAPKYGQDRHPAPGRGRWPGHTLAAPGRRERDGPRLGTLNERRGGSGGFSTPRASATGAGSSSPGPIPPPRGAGGRWV